MKKKSLVSSFIASALLPVFANWAGAQTPLLEFNFDSSGTTQNSTGTDGLSLTTVATDFNPANYVTDSPVGASGKAGDKVLHFSGISTVGGAQAGTAAGDTTVSSDYALTRDLASFTITAWISNVNANNNIQSLFALNSGTIPIIDFAVYGEANSPIRVQLAMNGTVGVVSDFGGSGPPIDISPHSATWEFVAATFDATTGKVIFYHGTNGGSDLIAYAPDGTQPKPTTNATSLYVGSQYYMLGPKGALDGDLDKVSFYNSALSAEQLAAIFQKQCASPGTSTSATK
jgi:hypothetical protein